MGQALPKPGLRPYLAADVPMLAAIFVASIEELTGDDYSEAQQEAWAAAAEDEEAFGKKLAGQLTLIATIQSAPVGFASLRGADHIDMLYVHPSVAGQGVASMLVEALEKLAGARGAKHLSVDASDTAESFFKKRGYDDASELTKNEIAGLPKGPAMKKLITDVLMARPVPG
jgi:putative acetyltransferase